MEIFSSLYNINLIIQKLMNFEVDNQTLKDLEIFDTVKDGKSVFSLYDFTQCQGGRKKLYKFLANPLTDRSAISERKDAILFFQTHLPGGLDIDKDALDFTEFYLRDIYHPTRLPSKTVAFERIIMDKLSSGKEYYIVEKGVRSTINLLKNIHQFSQILAKKLKSTENPPALLVKNNEEIERLFSKTEYQEIWTLSKLKAYDIARLDYLFRNTNKTDIYLFVNLIYEYDAYFSIAKAAEKYNFGYPEAVAAEGNLLEIKELFHPFVQNAIANDVRFDGSSNILFISGPNMAGKSTFLKSLGIAVYVAHTGLPVPARAMKFSVLSGLCTTINISDSLSSGYSHFYAEVMRIKNVAERLKANNNMMVIFDELFRGTNVKDAYDGTLAIVNAFAHIRSSFFVISTHIVEVAKELQVNKNINFSYFDILEEGGHPRYTYKLKEGVSDVRLGMYIIRKEGVIDLIEKIKA